MGKDTVALCQSVMGRRQIETRPRPDLSFPRGRHLGQGRAKQARRTLELIALRSHGAFDETLSALPHAPCDAKLMGKRKGFEATARD